MLYFLVFFYGDLWQEHNSVWIYINGESGLFHSFGKKIGKYEAERIYFMICLKKLIFYDLFKKIKLKIIYDNTTFLCTKYYEK